MRQDHHVPPLTVVYVRPAQPWMGLRAYNDMHEADQL